MKHRAPSSPAPAIGAVAIIAMVASVSCGSPRIGYVVEVVNRSGSPVSLTWQGDALFAGRESEAVAPCTATARGFEVGVRHTVWVVGPTDSGSFTIEAPSPRPTPPTRSVVVGPDGTVDLDADPWPQGEDPC